MPSESEDQTTVRTVAGILAALAFVIATPMVMLGALGMATKPNRKRFSLS